MKQLDLLKLMADLDDTYLLEAYEETLNSISFSKKTRKGTRRHSVARRLTFGRLAAVLTLVFALGITTYATGIVESVIAKMAHAWAVYDAAQGARYEAAGKKSNKEPETQNLTKQEGTSMTLEESFYDGESLMIVYSLAAEKEPLIFDFGPDSEEFGKLEKAEGFSLEFLRTNYHISDEDFKTLREKWEKDGKVGFRLKWTGLGDHVLLTDGLDLGPMMSMESDGKHFLECQDGLPEEAKHRQQLDIQFKIYCWNICFYVDGEHIFVHHPAPEEETVVFTVKNCNIP